MYKKSFQRKFFLCPGAILLLVALCLSARAEWPVGLRDRAFTAFDTETTGFGAKHHRIVEVGMVKFKNGKILDRKSWLINPGMPIPYYAEKVHGITDEMVADQPDFCAQLDDILAFATGTVLIAHNAGFDVSFMSAEIERCGAEGPGLKVIDSLPILRKCYPNAPSHSIEPLMAHLGMEGDRYHRATIDAEHIVRLLNRAMETPANAAYLTGALEFTDRRL